MAGEAIFLGYRRDDTADVAGRIYDAMALRFGKARVFKDVDNIGPGVDFGDYIKTVLPRCRVALVLIGPNWLASKSENGARRLDDTHDWVRIEIETALATAGVLVVPVLVNGARMPLAEELPDSLKPLVRRNAAIIRRDPDFHDDVERLATAIRSSVSTGSLDLSKIGGKGGGSRQGGNRVPLLIGGAVAAALVLGAVGFVAQRQAELAAREAALDAGKVVADLQASNPPVTPPTQGAPAPQDVAATLPVTKSEEPTRSPPPPVASREPPASTPVSAAEVQPSDVHTALMSLDAPLLRSLLAQGWNPNRVLDTDQNAALHDLMMVCERYPTHNPDTLVIVAKLLINAGADKRAANKFGDTPLSIASSPRYCGPGHPVTALLR